VSSGKRRQREVNFLNLKFLNFRGTRKSRKFAVDG